MNFFHITVESWPNKIVLSPREPVNISFGEPTKPRICVADSIEKCFMAVGRVLLNTNCSYVKVYKGVTNVELVPAEEIYDYWITNEQWIFEDCEFQYVETYFLNKSLRKVLGYFPYIHGSDKDKTINRANCLAKQLEKSKINYEF